MHIAQRLALTVHGRMCQCDALDIRRCRGTEFRPAAMQCARKQAFDTNASHAYKENMVATAEQAHKMVQPC